MERRAWDFHDFDDPDENPVTRFRHLGGDYGPYDPAYFDFDDEDDPDDWDPDSDDSIYHVTPETYEEFEKAQSKYSRNYKDEVEQTPGGPFITLYDTRYFVPQWDEQMLGPVWRQKRGKWDFDNPPKPLPPNDPKMKEAFRYCSECQLTWLVGHDKLEGHKHPEHYALQLSPEHSDDYRLDQEYESSIVVHIGGGSSAKGQKPKGQAGNPPTIALYFGKDSKYNYTIPRVPKHTPFDREEAELSAAELALTTVLYDVVKDLKAISRAAKKRKDNNDAEEGTDNAKIDKCKASATKTVGSGAVKSESDTREGDEDGGDTRKGKNKAEDDRMMLIFRVIMVLDNPQVVDNICKHQNKWKLRDGELLTKQGKPVKNGDWYQRVEEVVNELDDEGIAVKWYCVSPQFNKEATELARSCSGEFTGFDGEV